MEVVISGAAVEVAFPAGLVEEEGDATGTELVDVLKVLGAVGLDSTESRAYRDHH